jgi:hypothetical protein
MLKTELDTMQPFALSIVDLKVTGIELKIHYEITICIIENPEAILELKQTCN